MIALAFYLLKVLACSGVLFLYYFCFLRNRVFHQWNRFYLLAAVFISLLLPLIQFEIFYNDEHNGAMQLILIGQSADNYLQEIVITHEKSMAWENLVSLFYGCVSAFLLLSLFYSLHKIYSIIRSHTINFLHNIKFVDTAEKGAPFSFLDYIFWNREIPLHSETGQQIFQHELVHVQEKHTFDKLLMEVVIALFWCNPFFWLIRKELKYIHEFIADKIAVGEAGTEAFAAMVLQTTFPQQYRSIINPFFQTSIKRRIAMLTKQNNLKLAYAARIVALPLVALTCFAFTVRTSSPGSDAKQIASIVIVGDTPVNNEKQLILDTIPNQGKQIKAIDVRKKEDKKINELTITYVDGSSEKLTENEARQRGLLNNSSTKDQQDGKSTGIVLRGENLSSKDTAAQPLYILDGKEILKNEMNRLNPNNIQSVNVLKGESASKKYGDKGKYGVVEIITKEKDGTSANDLQIKAKGDRVQLKTSDASIEAHEITVVGYRRDKVEGNDVVFEKTEFNASIDSDTWREFLEKASKPILADLDKKGVPGGKYTVQVRFVVEKDGSLSSMSIVKEPGFGLGDKVLEIMKHAPKWKPAIQNQRVVRSYHTQPITFVVEGKPANT
jgi:beta-lactamase regulating signal transducer with metallopeptidase domain